MSDISGMSVAPLAGAWIEIILNCTLTLLRKVAPLAGAWIEIDDFGYSRRNKSVAPLAGAWIEIVEMAEVKSKMVSRSPRGSVD